ncbi:MAG: LPS assembly lipoprotein LptE [Rhodospirillaceae bacterium]|nr:LPS assembly lipoprotein LptE [Rhodospirillaceae bacterium]
MNDLYNIHVVPLENRDGQLLHNELLTNLNPHGEYYKPRYNLLVSSILSEKQHTFRKDSLATRNTLIYTVTFSLNEKSTRLFTDTFNQMFSYDYELLEKHYSNISAVDDIHHRAAKTIADEIRNRLAVYFIRSNKMKKENLINETNR